MKWVTKKPVGQPYWQEREWVESGPSQIAWEKKNSRASKKMLMRLEVLVVNLECGHAHWLGSNARLRKDGTYGCIECSCPNDPS